MIKKGDVEFATFSANGKQGRAALQKKCRLNTVHVDNVIRLSGVCNYYTLTRRNRKKFYGTGLSKIYKPAVTPYLDLDVSVHVDEIWPSVDKI